MLAFFNSNKKHFYVDEWITANTSTEKKSQQLVEKFIQRTEIVGDQDFNDKIFRLIAKSSRLATGSAILDKYLKLTKKIRIVQTEEKNEFSDGHTLSFGFLEKKLFYVTTNSEGEKVLAPKPKVAVFLHEIVHACHFYKNKNAYEARLKTASFIYDFHNEEEELTIRGKVYGQTKLNWKKYCENSVLKELGCPKRINHLGCQILKCQKLTFFNFLQTFCIGDMRKALIQCPELIDQLDVPQDIQEKCYNVFPDFAFSVKHLVDLVIFMCRSEELKLFLELGWQPTEKHAEKAFQFLRFYQKIKNQKSEKPKYTTYLNPGKIKHNCKVMKGTADLLVNHMRS